MTLLLSLIKGFVLLKAGDDGTLDYLEEVPVQSLPRFEGIFRVPFDIKNGCLFIFNFFIFNYYIYGGRRGPNLFWSFSLGGGGGGCF